MEQKFEKIDLVQFIKDRTKAFESMDMNPANSKVFRKVIFYDRNTIAIGVLENTYTTTIYGDRLVLNMIDDKHCVSIFSPAIGNCLGRYYISDGPLLCTYNVLAETLYVYVDRVEEN
jgi:hypothetical protein